MAKDSKKLVQAITSQEENFAQWYTDICVKAELVEYSSVKGFIILRPYGQAIWELIQKDMDARFKATGHENVAMPVLIPESLLQKEGELVNGFAPEVAWVTMGGSDKLEERLAVRPTSETMFCDHWSRVLHSYRELPMKYNQWCSVVRWEKTTRPFLRSREFWWQEGHTIHETAAEAEAETQQQLNCYADVCEQDLAIPVVKGRKTDKEKFAGAEATYTIEAMMKDGKALQSGTSHYFGDKFSKAYDVTFTGRDNQLHHPFQTSWGVSTRLVGAIIMTHGDDDGLILPPAVAPIQVVVVPIAAHKPGVSEKAAELAEKISKYARVKLDDSDNAPGWKFSQWEMKGVPLRLEIGPKDLEKNQCVLVRRDTREKVFVSLDELETAIPAQLEALRKDLYERALANREKRTWAATTMDEVKELAKANTGYIKTMWCGDLACEMKMKEEVGLSSRCMPFAGSGLDPVRHLQRPHGLPQPHRPHHADPGGQDRDTGLPAFPQEGTDLRRINSEAGDPPSSCLLHHTAVSVISCRCPPSDRKAPALRGLSFVLRPVLSDAPCSAPGQDNCRRLSALPALTASPLPGPAARGPEQRRPHALSAAGKLSLFCGDSMRRHMPVSSVRLSPRIPKYPPFVAALSGLRALFSLSAMSFRAPCPLRPVSLSGDPGAGLGEKRPCPAAMGRFPHVRSSS